VAASFCLVTMEMFWSELRQTAQDEGPTVGVVPQHGAANAQAVHINRIILGADEALLDPRIPEWIDPVAIRAPGEDLLS
jgi:hypothetical protein